MPVMRKREYFVIMPESGTQMLVIREINSTNVEWVGWPRSGEPLMVVQFNGKTRYGYIGVSRQRAVAAAYAPSTGKYINERIKPNYQVVRLR